MPNRGYGRVEDGRGLPDHGHHGAVRRRARIDVEQLHAVRRFDRVGNLLDHGQVAPLAEVGDALHQLAAHRVLFLRSAAIGDRPS
jgi:hypothetical protein